MSNVLFRPSAPIATIAKRMNQSSALPTTMVNTAPRKLFFCKIKMLVAMIGTVVQLDN
ncbi:MAG: hypothetical protein KGJ02_04355 [Verrucomicrobiota bacterium]|nr:hypothetical protein [Verrucomicrobiota bacterium]